MNIFEQASRDALRYPSNKGPLTTEQLWQLPLTSKGGFDLDTIAKTVNVELKSSAEESFVKVTTSANTEQQLKLDVLKHVIAYKLEALDKATKAAAKREQKRELLEALHDSSKRQLAQMTPEEIQAKLAALDD